MTKQDLKIQEYIFEYNEDSCTDEIPTWLYMALELVRVKAENKVLRASK